MLLNGVTFDSEGDSALHVVASAGNSKEYSKCAEIIYDKAKHLLQEINKKGDTPVHCAARAGNLNMVTCLIKMVGSENNGAVKHELLRKQNKIGETALHSAIRSGNFQLTEMLMREDPELAASRRRMAHHHYILPFRHQSYYVYTVCCSCFRVAGFPLPVHTTRTSCI